MSEELNKSTALLCYGLVKYLKREGIESVEIPPIDGYVITIQLENTRTPARQMIAEGLLNEVQKATKKFPLWPTDPLHAVAILNEEVGELNQAILQTIYEPEKSDKYDVRDEAIQAGAMLIRFMMSLDKYNYSCSIQHEQEVPKQSSEGEEG